MKSNHPDLFIHVDPIVNRLMILKWGTVHKHTSLPTFIARHKEPLLLIWPATSIDALIAAGDAWLARCPGEVCGLHKLGGLGEVMFATKLKSLVEGHLEACLKNGLEELVEKAVAEGTVCDKDTIVEWRQHMMLSAETTVMSLDILPSKRSVTIPYRSSEVSSVFVSCMADHCDLFIIAAMKGAAIFLQFLPELDAESMLGFVSGAGDRKLKVSKEYFCKAFLFKIYFLNLV